MALPANAVTSGDSSASLQAVARAGDGHCVTVGAYPAAHSIGSMPMAAISS